MKKIGKIIIITIIILILLVVPNKIKFKKVEPVFKGDYIACLNRPYSEDELSDNLLNKMMIINNMINQNKYKVSVKYEDIKTGFNYSYQENKVYYGASLIKLVDAIYLINKAINKEIDLDKETITYTKENVKSNSLGMAKREIGEEVSLRDLITYAITVSDNTAHIMLIDYIGFDNLQNYGKSLGADVILEGTDKFGHQTAHDTNIYLKEAYKIINDNEEYGPFLKEIMGNDHRNAYNTEDIKIYHKYGSWDVNYHDIGLNLDIDNPYAISILTLHEGKNYQEVIQNIHSKIIDLHETFYKERTNFCQKYLINS